MPIVPVTQSTPRAEPRLPCPEGPTLPRVRRRVRPIASDVPAAPPGEQPRAASSDYVVGYGRPPVVTRFQPGKSGNPKGRPKAAKSLNTLARELLTAKVPVRTGSGQKKMHRIEAVLHKAFELALKGNPRALTQILNLYAGAVPEAVAGDAPFAGEELTTTDLAILEELKASLLQGGNQ